MNEIENLERRANNLLYILENNSKKLAQQRRKSGSWNVQRLENTVRVVNDLRDIVLMIKELWEHPDRETIVGA